MEEQSSTALTGIKPYHLGLALSGEERRALPMWEL